jgi:hypothetical protein
MGVLLGSRLYPQAHRTLNPRARFSRSSGGRGVIQATASALHTALATMDERNEQCFWLEIEGGEGEAKTVHCPRYDRDMPLAGCLACKRFASLCLDPAGKHVYIDCDWSAPVA